MRVRIAIVLLLVFSLASIASAENPGKAIFTTKCALCHGADGTGKTSIGKTLNIPDFHSPDIKKLSDDDLEKIVANGKNKMPPFKGKLTEAQIDQVISYVRELGK